MLIVMKDMPCQRELNRRHATIPDRQNIVIEKLIPVSESARFSLALSGQAATFVAPLSTIERCCSAAKKQQDRTRSDEAK
jgi:hypothetical protein